MKNARLLVFIAILLLNTLSFGALNAYLRLTGEKLGEIKGGVTQAGREDSIMVIAYEHNLVSPRDAASGLPTGKRQHSPITITKEIDKSTPLLINAWSNGERMSNFELQFWQPSASGREVQFYTIRLRGARIVSINQEMLNNKYPENMQHKEREHISFVYDEIEWIYVDGGIEFDDHWEYAPSTVLISDVNGDGMVNLLDLSVLASEWLQ